MTDRLGDQSAALKELRELQARHEAKSEDEKSIFRFDDGDVVDYRLPPDVSFAEGLEADEHGYKPITWEQLKKKFCYERTAHSFTLRGEVCAKDMTHWERSKSVVLRDSTGGSGAVFFYDDDSKPYFAWEDVALGSTMELRSPRLHRFMDGQEGMRVESNKSVAHVARRRLTDEKRLEFGQHNKESGNRYFAEKRFENALSSYDQAISFVEGSFTESPALETRAKEIAASCYLNIAAVRIAEKKWSLVEYPCEKALSINATPKLNAKALYRLAQMYTENGELRMAHDKLKRALELLPGDAAVTQELDRIQQMYAELRQSQKSFLASATSTATGKSKFGYHENFLSTGPPVLEGLCAFRDLGGLPVATGGVIRRRVLYRSSNFHDATASDLAALQGTFGIKTVVDLRNQRETDSYFALVKPRNDTQKYVDYRTRFFPVEVACSTTKSLLSVPKSTIKCLRESSSAVAAGVNPDSTTLAQDLLDQCPVVLLVDLSTKSILSLLSWWRLVLAFCLGFLWLVRQASQMVVQNTAQKVGPLAVYLTILDKQKSELRFLFEEVLSRENNYPVVISCSLGKDRTGVVVALVLSVCGVSAEVIAADYARTGAMLSDGLKNFNSLLGLSKDWSETKDEVMLAFLSEIAKKYGSAQGYLKEIGVSEGALARLRAAVVKRAA